MSSFHSAEAAAKRLSQQATKFLMSAYLNSKSGRVGYIRVSSPLVFLLRALAYTAQYLHSKNANILVIAVGGAVNTVFLQSRNSTHDVDFFSEQLSEHQLQLLREAGLYAVERSSVPLSEDWLNNETSRMPGVVENIPSLIQVARQQNDVVFQAPGLTVLAAPWNYAFVKKIGRITQGTGRPYDSTDAASYLHQYIHEHGGQPVRVSSIQEWGRIYRANTPVLILQQVNELYIRTYRQQGIIF